jgi:hypothetical protein
MIHKNNSRKSQKQALVCEAKVGEAKVGEAKLCDAKVCEAKNKTEIQRITEEQRLGTNLFINLITDATESGTKPVVFLTSAQKKTIKHINKLLLP